MSFVWKLYGNYTRIDCWPAFEPKPDSEQAVDVGEHPMFTSRRIKQKEASTVRKHHLVRDLFGDVFPRGQIYLEDSTKGPILAGISTKTRSRFSRKRRLAPCVTIARGASVLVGCRIQRR